MKRAPDKRNVRLLDFLRDWSVPEISRPSNKIEPKQIRRASTELSRKLGDLQPRSPQPFDLDRVTASIRKAWKAHRSLASVAARDLRLAPWVLFSPRDRPELWLADDTELVSAWISWLRERGRSRTVITLLHQFISIYPKELPAFEQIRRTLGNFISKGDKGTLAAWRGRCDRFGILERDAPQRLLNHWGDGNHSFEQYLSEAGFAPGLLNSALVVRATEQLLERMQKSLGKQGPDIQEVTRSLEWIGPTLELRAELRVPVATALLTPFRERTPEPGIQDLLQAFLLRAIGDPRSRRDQWQGLEPYRNVLLRWLVKASLDDFFTVLDATASDAHWKYRKAFWSAYLAKKTISDAWVVLGSDAARIVRREFESLSGAGKLRSGDGTHASHSVLLMQIEHLTIAEWSHSGKCWIWSDSDKKLPKLYETEYRRGQLRDSVKPDRGIAHHGSERGTWQEVIARRIERETGIRVTRADYMPERKSWRR